MRLLLRCAMPQRVAIAVWMIVCAALLVKNAVSPNSHSVYPQYAQAARALAGDGAGSIYSVQHLPFFADLVYPFSMFADSVGSVLWLLTSLAVLVTGLQAFFARIRPDGVDAWPWMYLVVLVIGLVSLANNQSNIIITGCLLWGAVAVHDRRWWLAAACLAVPGFKMYPLALGMLYAALFPRRFAWRFAFAVGLTLAIPYVFHPAAAVSGRYADVFAYVTGSPHSQTYVLMNARDFLIRWGLPIGPKLFVFVQALTGISILRLMVYCRRRGISDDQIVWNGFMLTSLWFVTFGPSVESQTLLLAAPAIAWIFVKTWAQSPRSAAAVACAAALVVIGPLQTSLFGLAAQRAVAGAKVACPVLFAVLSWQMVLTWRQAGRPVAVSASRAASAARLQNLARAA